MKTLEQKVITLTSIEITFDDFLDAIRKQETDQRYSARNREAEKVFIRLRHSTEEELKKEFESINLPREVCDYMCDLYGFDGIEHFGTYYEIMEQDI